MTTLEVDAREGRRLTTPCRSAGSPGYRALSTFLGRVLTEVEGVLLGWLARLLRRLLTSESLPTVGMLEDVTEVSEFRRGLGIDVVLVVDDVGGRVVVFLRMDLMGCCCCSC